MYEITIEYEKEYSISEEDLKDKRDMLVNMGLSRREADEVWTMVREEVEREHDEQGKEWSEDVKEGFTNLMIELICNQHENLEGPPDKINIETDKGFVSLG